MDDFFLLAKAKIFAAKRGFYDVATAFAEEALRQHKDHGLSLNTVFDEFLRQLYDRPPAYGKDYCRGEMVAAIENICHLHDDDGPSLEEFLKAEKIKTREIKKAVTENKLKPEKPYAPSYNPKNIPDISCPYITDLGLNLKDVVTHYIKATYKACHENKSHTAHVLGISVKKVARFVKGQKK